MIIEIAEFRRKGILPVKTGIIQKCRHFHYLFSDDRSRVMDKA